MLQDRSEVGLIINVNLAASYRTKDCRRHGSHSRRVPMDGLPNDYEKRQHQPRFRVRRIPYQFRLGRDGSPLPRPVIKLMWRHFRHFLILCIYDEKELIRWPSSWERTTRKWTNRVAWLFEAESGAYIRTMPPINSQTILASSSYLQVSLSQVINL